MHRIAFIIAALFSAGAVAEVGEPGGAYGGGTAPETGRVDFQEADRDDDGVLTVEEARNAGIEHFEEGDRNQDGLIDAAEFAAMEPTHAEDEE